MKVRAKEYGQYQGRMRETGDVFEIKDKDLASWMEVIPEPPAAPVVPAKREWFK
jgi:hypothetical protein